MSDTFPILDLKGSHFDIGFTHGQRLSKAIKSNLALYEDMVRGMTGMDLGKALKRSRPYRDVLQEHTPHLLEEMEGIGRGADVTLDEVVFLNARTELMSVRDPAAVGECTAMGLTGERTVGGHPLLAQNWDWHHRVINGTALFRVSPPGRPTCLLLAEAGQVGKIGINDNGLGVLLNILFCGKVRIGLPVHVLLRCVLEMTDVANALSFLQGAPRASSSHFLVGDAPGNIMGLELTPETIGRILPVRGAVVHTNHFCDPSLKDGDEGPTLFPDSIPRFDRADGYLKAREKWDMNGLRGMFVNHEEGPASICRHLDPHAPEHMQIVTVASVFLRLSERAMDVSCGRPCRNAYQRIALQAAT
ncbi:MAG: hypothetical protein JRJ60_06480 [Deltaproteobacteria bacterium]|nr:hypothetical protein [Deltaproteobacteria bacterium]